MQWNVKYILLIKTKSDLKTWPCLSGHLPYITYQHLRFLLITSISDICGQIMSNYKLIKASLFTFCWFTSFLSDFIINYIAVNDSRSYHSRFLLPNHTIALWTLDQLLIFFNSFLHPVYQLIKETFICVWNSRDK